MSATAVVAGAVNAVAMLTATAAANDKVFLCKGAVFLVDEGA